MRDHIVFDLETQHEFSEVGGRDYPHLLKVSLAGCYSYAGDKFFTFEERDMAELGALLARAELVIGFNIKYFDYAVLQPYLKELNLKSLPACDIMEDVANVVGFRLSLDSIAKATLGAQKSGHGLDAIRYFREGNMDALKKYCLDDVKLTRDIFEYGKAHGEVKYWPKYGVDLVSVPVSWLQYQFKRPPENQVLAAAAKVNRETGNYSLF